MDERQDRTTITRAKKPIHTFRMPHQNTEKFYHFHKRSIFTNGKTKNRVSADIYRTVVVSVASKSVRTAKSRLPTGFSRVAGLKLFRPRRTRCQSRGTAAHSIGSHSRAQG